MADIDQVSALVRKKVQQVLESRTYDKHAYDEEVWDETLDDVTNTVMDAISPLIWTTE